MPSAEQLEQVRAILDTVYDIVADEPDGVPSGTLYAALMQYGCTINAYEQIILLLKHAGKLEERHNKLYATMR